MERVDALKADEGIVTESPVNHMKSHDASKLVDQQNNTAMSNNGNTLQSLRISVGMVMIIQTSRGFSTVASVPTVFSISVPGSYCWIRGLFAFFLILVLDQFHFTYHFDFKSGGTESFGIGT